MVDPSVAAHCLLVALYVIPALALAGLLIESVPRWMWGGLIAACWAFAAATMPIDAAPLTTARLVQAGASGLLVGCVCALPWLMLRLGVGVFAKREVALQGLLEIAVLLAFLSAGGLTSLLEVIISGARAGLAPPPGDVARWAATAALHGLWLGIAIAAIGAVLAAVIGFAAPRLDADVIGGVTTMAYTFAAILIAPLLMRFFLRAVAEVFAKLLALSV